ncbi:transmembrane protein, putative (macronuclear) [Tetrahymena thermophila SB210]|uniref:Transmembrane protein, putative n=1 Tax=Tetrahymena thermophila (strain SB210) TaxID=312017 RepID=Q22T78_TETTS|nr:transmembrane protein, putative [Tetrahymena thermophila SB210]EAR88560.1 transmembrane protein, putative [Tetrahymena thermophila SB210]|eukprot:XP_001008805.1 transmembrane protein, putative [Tetrahymena thermophila SB210]
MLKKIVLAAIALSALFGLWFCSQQNYVQLKEFTKYYGDCTYQQADFSMIGPEDAVFYDENTLIGCHSNLLKIYIGIPLNEIENGGCYAVTGIASQNLQIQKLELIGYPKELDFYPHGQYIIENTYYVCNHGYEKSDGDRIDVFDVVKSQNNTIYLQFKYFTHLGPRFTGDANDLVVLNNQRFLVTDWYPIAFPLEGPSHLTNLEKIKIQTFQALKIRGSHLWDCQFKINQLAECEIVEGSDGVMVNGVAFDQKETILTSDTIGQKLRSFKIQGDGSLKLHQVIDTRLAADNINFDKVRNQFLVAGTLNSEKDSQVLAKNMTASIELIQNNPGNQSLVTYWAGVDIVKLEEQTNQLITEELFTAEKANVIVAGGLVSHSGDFLFLTSYGDKSISVCKKQN